MKSWIVAATVAGLFAGVYAERAASRPQYRKTMSGAEKAACIRRGGKVMVLGLGQNENCVLPMRDAGKVCTDGSQCRAGSCIAGDSPPARRKAPAKGVCPADDNNWGCRTLIVKGRVVQTLCAE